MPLCQVPQVDGELVEPVVAQVPMGQDAVKEGKAQRTLAFQGLKQKTGYYLALGLWPGSNTSSSVVLLVGKLLNPPSPSFFICRRIWWFWLTGEMRTE